MTKMAKTWKVVIRMAKKSLGPVKKAPKVEDQKCLFPFINEILPEKEDR